MSTVNKTTEQPAIKSYFFGKGYTDLWATIVDAWKRNLASAGGYGAKGITWLEQDGWGKLPAAFWFGAALSVFIFVSLFTLLISIIHIGILLAFFSIIYFFFSVIYIVERFYMLLQVFFPACPACSKHFNLPIYICDKCGSEHPRLIPSSYGIIHHRCRKCKQYLPCTFFANRGRLLSKCPNCGIMLSREHTESRKQFLPIIGGTSAGKSAYLFSLCRHFHEVTAAELGLTASIIDRNQALAYQRAIVDMDHGREPDVTYDKLPKAFDLLFSQNNRAKLALYLYDPAGEAFLDTSNLASHQFLEYTSGIILLVDPFSFDEIKNRYSDQLRNTELNIRPSTANINDIVTRLIRAMEQYFNLSPNDKIKFPLAVVISKVDAFDLDSIIGESALNSFPKQLGGSNEQHQNRMIKMRLMEWGEAHFVHQLEQRFAKIGYFTVSALGHSPDKTTTRFEALRVDKPALWLLSQSNRMWIKNSIGNYNHIPIIITLVALALISLSLFIRSEKTQVRHTSLPGNGSGQLPLVSPNDTIRLPRPNRPNIIIPHKQVQPIIPPSSETINTIPTKPKIKDKIHKHRKKKLSHKSDKANPTGEGVPAPPQPSDPANSQPEHKLPPVY